MQALTFKRGVHPPMTGKRYWQQTKPIEGDSAQRKLPSCSTLCASTSVLPVSPLVAVGDSCKGRTENR